MKMHVLGLLISRKAALALLSISASTIPAQASAATVLFTLTGAVQGTFTLPQSPTPASADATHFTIDNIPATIDNASTSVFASFDTTGANTEMAWGSPIEILLLNGAPQPLFTGSTSAPTFTLGTYVFSSSTLTFGNPSQTDDAFETLVISQVAAVPEPGSWAMMLLGFGAIGYAMRRKARVAALPT